MNERPRKGNQTGPEALHSDESDGKRGKEAHARIGRPRWPAGLQLSAKEDITCFIPGNLGVILSWEAFEQLFAYAYSTTTYIALAGNVRRTLASVLTREAWPAALPLASNTVALLRFRLAMVTVTLARTTCQGARP
jgi:hypothetical protein